MFFTVSQHISLAFVFQCRIFYPLWKNLYINVNIFCDSLMLTSPNHSLRFFCCWWPFLFYCSWWSILFFSRFLLPCCSGGLLVFFQCQASTRCHLRILRRSDYAHLFTYSEVTIIYFSMRNTKKKNNYRYMRIWEKYFLKSKCT